MQWSDVRPSVRLSVSSVDRCSRRYLSIAARRWAPSSSGAAAALGRSSKCGQCHVNSERRKPYMICACMHAYKGQI